MHSRGKRKRTWRFHAIITLLVLIAMAAIAATVTWHRLASDYGSRAEQYDLDKLHEMESASIIYDRDGQVLGKIFVRNRDTIPLRDMPYHLVQAVIAAEDNRFFQHHGVDYIGMIRAAISNWRAGRITQGASTLTQQLARNTYSLRERSYERKLVEVFLAMRIEDHLDKRDILELYLNRVYFGAGLYGVEAASRGYFRKPAADLTVQESAMLAGLLKSPNNLSPWSDRAAAEAETDRVLGKMHELDMLTDEEFQVAVDGPLDVRNRRSLFTQSYAIDYIRQQVIAQIGFENAVSEGYRIFTTIDSNLQAHAEQALRDQLTQLEKTEGYAHPTYAEHARLVDRLARNAPQDDTAETADRQPAPPLPEYIQGALLMLHNGTGGILAMVGGRDFEHSEYNRAVLARRPAGTAFLPFVYGAAYEKGFSPGYLLDDAPLNNRHVMIGGTTGVLGEWGPERVMNKYEGSIPASEALLKSKNAASVRLGLRAGLESVREFARGLGIESPLRPFPATFLGSSEVSLLEMTRAFTAIPRGGTYPASPPIITRIEEKNGQVVFRSESRSAAGLSPEVAHQLHRSLSESLETGTADKATLQYGLKRFEAGGKTGTAYDFTDLWFIGYNSEVTCGVWVGFDKPRTIFRGAFSSDIALPIWVEMMNASIDDFPPRPIPQPDGLEPVTLLASTGMPPPENQAVPLTDKATFSELLTRKQIEMIQSNGLSLLETETEGGQWPRAQAAANLRQVEPVPVKSPTVVGGIDPYSSITKTVMKAEAVQSGEGGAAEIRRAQAVRPFDQPLESPAVSLDPPDPLEF